MGVYMGVFNFFIVIPEIIASLGFGPLTRAVFGRDNPDAPLYMVMLGGVCLLVAAACVVARGRHRAIRVRRNAARRGPPGAVHDAGVDAAGAEQRVGWNAPSVTVSLCTTEPHLSVCRGVCRAPDVDVDGPVSLVPPM